MKKIVSLVIAMLLVLGCALGEMSVGMPNPYTEYETLEEINEIALMNLTHPAVMGVTDEKFYIIESGEYIIAEYDFTLNGYEYCFRACGLFDDISGVYIDGDTAFANAEGEGIQYAEGEGMKLARWLTIDGQYVLIVNDNGEMAQDTFESICEELKDIVDPALSEAELEIYYSFFEGSYYDEVSERAVMEVVANGSESLTMIVYWADSAFETYVWTMTGKLYEDGLIGYDDLEAAIITTAEDGTETVEPIEAIAEGWFVPTENGLAWEGAADEQLSTCRFVEITEE